MDIKQALENYAETPITRQIALSILKDYKRPNDKINELVKSGILTALKRGFYIPGPKSKILGPELFLIANHLWGPSYISMESALSYWGYIPEKVYEISSITLKATKVFNPNIGRFSFAHVGLPYYSFGQKTAQLTPKQSIIIGSPEKALCDKIITTSGILLRSTNQVIDFLIEDMRIDEEKLKELNLSEIASWIPDAPKKNSLEMLIKTLYNL